MASDSLHAEKNDNPPSLIGCRVKITKPDSFWGHPEGVINNEHYSKFSGTMRYNVLLQSFVSILNVI